MSYKNKTYVIFDGDEDMWAYRFMRGWNASDRMEFDFNDAHDLKPLTDRASEETVKARLRERLAMTKQVLVLVGEKTKNLYRFVRWEIETAQKLGLPIIVANLNEKRRMDDDRCPPILRDHCAAHISFKMRIIQFALENFPAEYARQDIAHTGPRYYDDSVYQKLGL